MQNQVKRITEGAMMCALLGLLLVVNRQLANTLGIFFVVIMPIPVILYTAKYGVKHGVWVAFSVGLMSILFGELATIIYVVVSMILGLVYGHGIYKDQSGFIILFKSIIIIMILEFMVGYFFASLFGIDVLAEMKAMTDLVGQTLGLADETLYQISFTLMIGSIALLAVNETIIVHLISLTMIKRLKIKERKVRSIFDLKIPKYLAVSEMILCVLVIFITFSPFNDTIKVVLLLMGYISIIHLFAFGFIGCLWMGHIFMNKNITLYLALACAVLFMFSVPLLVGIGFAYNTIDFKKIVSEVKHG